MSEQLLIRWKEGVEIYDVSSNEEGEMKSVLEGDCSFHSISSDGKKLVVHMRGKGVIICSMCRSEERLQLKDSERVQCAWFSPKNNFIATWQRHQKEEKNLKVYNASDGTLMLELIHKGIPKKLASQQRQQESSKGQWSALQWTEDEELLLVGRKQAVAIYQNFVFWKEIPNENLKFFSVSNKPKLEGSIQGYFLMTFTPECKGKPARVCLRSILEEKVEQIVSKSFYQSDECTIQWSPVGDAALVVTQVTVDKTGQSYYGSANIYLMTTEDAIQLPNPSGLVHHVEWCPKKHPSSFIMISGKMPAMASLHHGLTGDVKFLLGEKHRNTIVFSPHGRFFALGGFGNLAGNIDFWDINKQKPIPRYDTTNQPVFGNSVNCAVGYGFSPSSRLFFVSTTSPRMNVENQIQLFRYNGHPVQLPESFMARYLPNKLLAAEFVPQAPGSFPDRPQSPPPKGVSTANATPPPERPTSYVPPAMRNRSSASGGSLAQRMRQQSYGNTHVTVQKSNNPPGYAPKKTIPGLAPTAKPKKNKKKAKPKEEKELTPPPEKEKEPVPQPPKDPEKRIKKIKKLLKQIDELKRRNYDELNDDQKQKIKTESALLLEMEQLALSL